MLPNMEVKTYKDIIDNLAKIINDRLSSSNHVIAINTNMRYTHDVNQGGIKLIKFIPQKGYLGNIEIYFKESFSEFKLRSYILNLIREMFAGSNITPWEIYSGRQLCLEGMFFTDPTRIMIGVSARFLLEHFPNLEIHQWIKEYKTKCLIEGIEIKEALISSDTTTKFHKLEYWYIDERHKVKEDEHI